MPDRLLSFRLRRKPAVRAAAPNLHYLCTAALAILRNIAAWRKPQCRFHCAVLLKELAADLLRKSPRSPLRRTARRLSQCPSLSRSAETPPPAHTSPLARADFVGAAAAAFSRCCRARSPFNFRQIFTKPHLTFLGSIAIIVVPLTVAVRT